MRNIFDQYNQPENRLTHALLSSLDADRYLLADFVHWVTGQSRPSSKLVVHEQSFPDGTPVLAPEEGERRGIPDGCIADESGWALLIESKLVGQWNPDQLRRHRVTAERRGLTVCTVLCLTVGRSPQPIPDGCIARTWEEVYAWLSTHVSKSEWARRCSQYFEVAEAQLIDGNGLPGGAITVFTGIPFGPDEPYSYLQAKRLLGLLRTRTIEDAKLVHDLAIDAKNPGRGAITGTKGRVVWDYLGLMSAREAKSFTEYPHLTLGIGDDRLEAMLTVPNGLTSHRRRAVLGATFEDFEHRLGEVVRGIETASNAAPGLRPVIQVLQRHYTSQRAEPVRDATLRFDPRTAVPTDSTEGVRHQPQWLRAAFDVLDNRTSNVQFQIGADFLYASCPTVRSPSIATAVSKVWRACRPLILGLQSA